MAMVVLVHRRCMVVHRCGAILPDTTHMVVVTDLWLPYGGLEPGQAHAILAQSAVHVWTTVDGLLRALRKDLHQERVHIEIVRTQKLGVRVADGALLRQLPNTLF